MLASRRGFGSILAALIVVALATGCAFGGTSSPRSPSCPAGGALAPTASAGPAGQGRGDLVIVGRIVTMDDPPIAEALLIEAGLVTCVGTRDEVLARADDEVPIVDIGQTWRIPGSSTPTPTGSETASYYGIDSAEEAMDAALSRGWTSISEQWVNPERLDELEALAADDALPLRVDAYLALNFGNEFLGDWYASREPGPVERPPPRPGVEDPPRRWLGHDRALGAARISRPPSAGRTRPAGRYRSTP